MTLVKVLAAQLFGGLCAFGLMHLVPTWFHSVYHWLAVQGLSAAIGSKILRQPYWWSFIHLVFLPVAWILLSLEIPPNYYLFIVGMLTLIFWGTVKGDVPLFLSSRAVAEVLHQLIAQETASRFADFGAGVGSVILPLAQHCPNLALDAFERAPIPWLICYQRARKWPNIRVIRGSFWKAQLSDYDLVFAFLSPAVMAQIGEQVRLKMRPGTLFVSSSFPVPDWEPETILHVKDRRNTQLFCYRVGFYID